MILQNGAVPYAIEYVDRGHQSRGPTLRGYVYRSTTRRVYRIFSQKPMPPAPPSFPPTVRHAHRTAPTRIDLCPVKTRFTNEPRDISFRAYIIHIMDLACERSHFRNFTRVMCGFRGCRSDHARHLRGSGGTPPVLNEIIRSRVDRNNVISRAQAAFGISINVYFDISPASFNFRPIDDVVGVVYDFGGPSFSFRVYISHRPWYYFFTAPVVTWTHHTILIVRYLFVLSNGLDPWNAKM